MQFAPFARRVRGRSHPARATASGQLRAGEWRGASGDLPTGQDDCFERVTWQTSLMGLEDLPLLESDVRPQQLPELPNRLDTGRLDFEERPKSQVFVTNALGQSGLPDCIEAGQQMPLLDQEVRLEMARERRADVLPEGISRRPAGRPARLNASLRQNESRVVIVGEITKLGDPLQSILRRLAGPPPVLEPARRNASLYGSFRTG